MQSLTVTVFDRDTGRPVDTANNVNAEAGDQFIKNAYRNHPDRPLSARIEVDLDDECLEW